jgi:hypothetical protein
MPIKFELNRLDGSRDNRRQSLNLTSNISATGQRSRSRSCPWMDVVEVYKLAKFDDDPTKSGPGRVDFVNSENVYINFL